MNSRGTLSPSYTMSTTSTPDARRVFELTINIDSTGDAPTPIYEARIDPSSHKLSAAERSSRLTQYLRFTKLMEDCIQTGKILSPFLAAHTEIADTESTTPDTQEIVTSQATPMIQLEKAQMAALHHVLPHLEWAGSQASAGSESTVLRIGSVTFLRPCRTHTFAVSPSAKRHQVSENTDGRAKAGMSAETELTAPPRPQPTACTMSPYARAKSAVDQEFSSQIRSLDESGHTALDTAARRIRKRTTLMPLMDTTARRPYVTPTYLPIVASQRSAASHSLQAPTAPTERELYDVHMANLRFVYSNVFAVPSLRRSASRKGARDGRGGKSDGKRTRYYSNV
jgi:hypothetical protein